MDLRWPMAVVAAGALVVVLLAWWCRSPRTRRPAADARYVAHLALLGSLPRFRRLRRRRLVAYAVQTAAVGVLLAGAALTIARPTVTSAEEPEKRSRDIVLCLDASGSMREANARIIVELDRVVAGLDGDRVALAAFSGATLTLFPLTDDYDFARAELARAADAFGSGDPDYALGTQLSDDRASQMGDGLVSCTQRFDRPEEERSRVVVLTTDMDPQGRPVYPLGEAAALAADQSIVVHAVGNALDAPRRAELGDAASSTGGGLFEIDAAGGDGDTAAGIVAGIESLERRRLEEPPRLVRQDRPAPALAVVATGSVLVVVSGLLTSRRRRTPEARSS